MSATAGLHLVVGDEDLLVERAVSDILRAARSAAGSDDVPVNRLRAGEVSTNELAELLSPSLFADERMVILEAAAEAGKDAAALIAGAAADLPPGTVLVVLHAGGGRAALSLSPWAAAPRNARMAVCSEDFTDLFRSLRRSLVRLRFFCDLILATRQYPSHKAGCCAPGLARNCPRGTLRDYQEPAQDPKAEPHRLRKRPMCWNM